jgi:hypothetical protein
MSIKDFIGFLGDHALVTAIALVSVPLAAFLWSLVQGKREGARSPWKYGYSVLVYLACIPGVFAAVLVSYALFFTRQSLLNVNALAYFLPIAAMIATLLVVRNRVSFAALPGFGRLSGLIVMIAVSFVIALAIDKTRIFLGFFGTIDRLFILVAAIFILLKAGFWLAFGRRKREA